MIKQDIAKELVQRGICTSYSSALQAVEGITEILAESFARGENVFLRGFATLKVVQRKQRKGYDIQNHKAVTIPERNDIKFITSKKLSKQLNGDKAQ